MLKTFDPFEVCKLFFRSSCKLDTMLQANGMQKKSADGAQAVEWAAEGRWDDIAEYCMQDARLTHRVCSLCRGGGSDLLLLPESSGGGLRIPLTGWSRPVMVGNFFQ